MKEIKKGMVSVVLNCFNGEKYLRYSLESIISQTYDNLELLFIDNHSTDSSCEIFQSYIDDRFKYFKPNKHLKLGAARNYAINNISGEYIAFIDSDDIWRPDKLSKQINFMKEKNANILYTQAVNFFEDGREAKYSKKSKETFLNIYKVVKDYDICFSTIILSSSILINQKYYFDVELKVAEDLDFILRLAMYDSIYYMPLSTTYYRVHKNSDTYKYKYSFIEDLDLMKIKFISQDIDTELLKPAYRTAYWLCSMDNWINLDSEKCFENLYKIEKWQIRHFIMFILFRFPPSLILPILKIAGKKIRD